VLLELNERVSLGRAPSQADLLRSTVNFCEGRVAPESLYGVLHRECFTLLPDEMFADLFTDVGRRSVPPMIVAVVMVLQRLEGPSDREAVERFAFDARWKYAAGGLEFDYPGFVHTVLVDMRARLARSERPNRIFATTLQVAQAAGLVGRHQVLDSTPVYDAVATMDTVTLVRSAIRGLLTAADAGLEAELRALLARDDDYTSAGKPVCDYEDPAARRRWWMRRPATRWRWWVHWRSADSSLRWTGRPSCWPRWWAKTWTAMVGPGCFVSPGGSPRIG
jgi:Transposase domain (DUF772)